MAQLVFEDMKHMNNVAMKFTIGSSSEIKEEIPIYAIDYVTNSFSNKTGVIEAFKKHHMLPKSSYYTSMKDINLRIASEFYKSDKVIYGNALLKEQASHMLRDKKVNVEAKEFQSFITEFLELTAKYDGFQYMESHRKSFESLFLLVQDYYRVVLTEDDKKEKSIEQVKQEIINLFQDYDFLRKNCFINEYLKEYIAKKEEEIRFKKFIYEKKKQSLKKEQPEVAIPISEDDYEYYTIEKSEDKKGETPIRALCLLISSEVDPLVLLEDNSYQLDKQIVSKFSSSEDVRKKYQKEISEYLNKNADDISKVSKKNYRGQVVVLERGANGKFKRREDGQYEKIAVIYSDIWKKIKTMTLNVDKMRDLILKDASRSKKGDYVPLFSEFSRRKLMFAIKRQNNKRGYIKERNSWLKEVENSKNPFEILRDLKYYIEKGKLKYKCYKEEKQELQEAKEILKAEYLNGGEELTGVLYDPTNDTEEFLEEEEYNNAFHLGQDLEGPYTL